MCPQTVGLIAAELERRGIATVCVQPVRHIAERVRPPRSLLVPFRLGRPLGHPSDPKAQHHAIWQAIRDHQPEAADRAARGHIEFVRQSMDDNAREEERRSSALRRLGEPTL